MKITLKQLKEIINEELQAEIQEQNMQPIEEAPLDTIEGGGTSDEMQKFASNLLDSMMEKGMTKPPESKEEVQGYMKKFMSIFNRGK